MTIFEINNNYKYIKKMKKQHYTAPTVEIVEVVIEQGIATTGGDFDVPKGNDFNGGWV